MRLLASVRIDARLVLVNLPRVRTPLSFERPNGWQDVLVRGDVCFPPHLPVSLVCMRVNLCKHSLLELSCIVGLHGLPIVQGI